MIVDTSAVIALIVEEPDHERILRAITEGGLAGIGAPTMFEAELVMSARLGPSGHGMVRHLVDGLDLNELPFEAEHRREATAAFLRFGKGRHSAALNLGDCMSYAAASVASQPLLCVGDDFARTDLEIVSLPD